MQTDVAASLSNLQPSALVDGTMAFALAQNKVACSPAARAGINRRVAVVPRAALTLKDPPYALDALEPHMSKQTLEFHWGEF